MANEIVKFNNQFNNVALKGFTSQELNLLITIASKLKEKKGEKVTFDFFDLKKYIKLNKNETTKEFIKNVMNVNKKLLKINFTFYNQNKIIQFALFKSFVIDTDLQTLEVSVNDEFLFLLNELTSNFTRFELEEFVKFKSTYTKEFYRRMKQFRHTGVWKISIDDFNRLLGISESYKISDIDKRVFQPILNELGEKYNLKIIKKYSKKTGRGRSSVSGFEFHFKKENRRIAEQENLEGIKQAGFDIEKVREHKIKEKIQKEEKNRINKVSDFYLYRKVKMYDSFYEQYNYLEILAFNQKNDKLNVKIRNVDDGYVQDFTFDSFKNFENWFRKYAI
jgi:repA